MIGDESEQRIEQLIKAELEFIVRDANGWQRLFRDPTDGRLWELTYPMSEMHGGGPKLLRHVSAAEAEEVFHVELKK